MTNANWAYGSTLTCPAGVIAEIDEIGAFAPSADTIDVTTLVSTGGYREFIGGLRDGGEITLRGNFYPGNAGQIAMKTYLDDGVARAYTLTMPVAMGATVTFNGIVTGMEAGPFPADGKVAFGSTIKITGVPAINVTASVNITALTGVEQNLGAALDFVPNFLAATYLYNTQGLNTASNWIQITATFAAGVGTVTCLGVTQTILTTVQSGQIVIGLANTLTDVVITIKETNKMPTVYTVHVSRP